MQAISLHPVLSLKMLCLSKVGRNLYKELYNPQGMLDSDSSLPVILKCFVAPLIRSVQSLSLPSGPRIAMLEPLLNTGSVTELELSFDLKAQTTWKLLEDLATHGKQFTGMKFYNNISEDHGFCRTTVEMVPSKINSDLQSLFLACENLEKLDIHVPFDVKVLHGKPKLKILALRFELSNLRDLIPEDDRLKGALHTLIVPDNSFKQHDIVLPLLLKAYPELRQVRSIRSTTTPYYPIPFEDTQNELNPLKLTWIEVGELSFDILEFAEIFCPNLKFLNFELIISSMSQPLQDKLALTGYSLGILCNQFEGIHGNTLRFFEKLGNQVNRLNVSSFPCEVDVQKLDDLCPNLEYLKLVILELKLFVGVGSRSGCDRNPYSNLKELYIMSCEKFGLEKIEKTSLTYLLNNCNELEKLHFHYFPTVYIEGLSPPYFFPEEILLQVLRSNNLQNLKSFFLKGMSLSLKGLTCFLTNAKSLEKLTVSGIENTGFDSIQSRVHRINPFIVNWVCRSF